MHLDGMKSQLHNVLVSASMISLSSARRQFLARYENFHFRKVTLKVSASVAVVSDVIYSEIPFRSFLC
jgi:hypothetical protein